MCVVCFYKRKETIFFFVYDFFFVSKERESVLWCACVHASSQQKIICVVALAYCLRNSMVLIFFYFIDFIDTKQNCNIPL